MYSSVRSHFSSLDSLFRFSRFFYIYIQIVWGFILFAPPFDTRINMSSSVKMPVAVQKVFRVVRR